MIHRGAEQELIFQLSLIMVHSYRFFMSCCLALRNLTTLVNQFLSSSSSNACLLVEPDAIFKVSLRILGESTAIANF